jgi:LacI family transcriptional regulator
MKKKTPSLGDIAKQVHVSKMTISLALRDSREVSVEMRDKIHAVAREMGYSRSPQMSYLMAEVARVRNGIMRETLAFVTTEPTENGWKKYDFDEFNMMKTYAAQRGYNLEPWWLANPALPPERVNEILWSRGITGIVIPNISRKFFEKHKGTLPIEWDKFCIVEMGGGLRYPSVHQVLHGHYHGMFLALDELEALGYQRIGFCVRSEDDLRTHHRWTAAYHVWLHLRKLKLQPLIAPELEASKVKAWIASNRLDAVVSPGIPDIKKWGITQPKKIGFASLHLWGKKAKSVTGIDQEMDEASFAAVDLLASLVSRKQKGLPEHPMHWLIPGHWAKGKTAVQVRKIPRPVGIENEVLGV